MASDALRFVRQNLNALAFVGGFALFGYGVQQWSSPAACVLSGLVMMGVSAWPYVRPKPVRKP